MKRFKVVAVVDGIRYMSMMNATSWYQAFCQTSLELKGTLTSLSIIPAGI
jgi:hypothetical protein